jgi:hypothetical protein
VLIDGFTTRYGGTQKGQDACASPPLHEDNAGDVRVPGLCGILPLSYP